MLHDEVTVQYANVVSFYNIEIINKVEKESLLKKNELLVHWWPRWISNASCKVKKNHTQKITFIPYFHLHGTVASKGKLYNRKQISGCQESRVGGGFDFLKGHHEGIWGGEGTVLYLDCGSYMHLSKLTELFTLHQTSNFTACKSVINF